MFAESDGALQGMFFYYLVIQTKFKASGERESDERVEAITGRPPRKFS